MDRPRNREFRNKVINHPFDKDNFELIPGNNLVLVKVYQDTNITPGGIHVGDKQWEPANHAERVFEIIQVPKSLKFDPNDHERSMMWKTDIEIKEGDIAWCDYLLALNAWRFEYKGEEYRTIPYSAIYVVKRKKAIIPCNGYCLFEPAYKYSKFMDYVKKDVDLRFGTVKHIGKPNQDYIHDKKYNRKLRHSRSDYGVDIKVGDVVIFDKSQKIVVMLESQEHATFDNGKPYRVSHRYRLLGVLG